MAHAVDEVRRVDGVTVDLDDRSQVTLEDEPTFRLIRTTHTLGCFQIESPGQRELVGKFAPETFEDLIIDISLFRPGPVKSDMVTPFLLARQGWREPEYLHPTLVPALGETYGVVVFHEQVLRIVTETTGVTLAQADEVRRALGSPAGPAGGRGLVASGRRGPRLRGRRPRPHLGGAQGVRLVRVLQGPRGGVRAPDLPVGLAQGPPPGSVPRRGAHPRPGHVPQAADPRRRPRPGHHGPGPGRQRLAAAPTGSSGSPPQRRRWTAAPENPASRGGWANPASGGRRENPASGGSVENPGSTESPKGAKSWTPPMPRARSLSTGGTGRCGGAGGALLDPWVQRRSRAPRPARRPGLRHPALPGRRQGHQRRRGRADRGRPALRHPGRLLATGPTSAGRWSSGW